MSLSSVESSLTVSYIEPSSTPSPIAVESENTDSSVTGDSSDGNSDSTSTTGLTIAIVAPVVVLIVICIAVVLFLRYRSRLRDSLSNRRDGTGRSRTRAETGSSTRMLTAEQLSGSPSRTDVNVNGGERATPAAANPRRGRRGPRGDHLRRTESGRSVRTLPVYSKEAGEEELVLVRQRSDSMFSDDDTVTILDQVLENEAGEELDISDARRSRDDTASTSITIQEADLDDNELATRSESPSVPHSAPPAPVSQNGDRSSTTEAVRGSLSQRGWGEAPTYLEAMSSPPFHSYNTDMESGTTVPPPTIRTRTTSAFRDILSRAGFNINNSNRHISPMSQNPYSTTALPLLQPQTSRLSSNSSAPFRGSWSGYPSPGQSTHSLLISSPIPNSAVRASFDSTIMPRAGLSDDQMRFLSSSEAVNLAGVRLGDPPEGRRRRRETNGALSVMTTGTTGDDLPPPTWEQSEDQRRGSLTLDIGEGSGSSGNFDMDDTTTGERDPNHVSGHADQGQSSSQADTGGPPSVDQNGQSGVGVVPPLPLPTFTPALEIEPPTPTVSDLAPQIPVTGGASSSL